MLIQGASGGVGHLAVQIAKAKGLHVTATCSGGNADFVKVCCCAQYCNIGCCSGGGGVLPALML